MQTYRNQLKEKLDDTIASPLVKSGQPQSSVNHRACFLRWSGDPRLRQRLSHGVWLSFALVLLVLGAPHQGQALPNPLEGTREEGHVTTNTVPVSVVNPGVSHTCILKSDGTVACWGDNFYGQATPPDDAFSQISAGAGHTCGVRSNSTVACWGDDRYGQATPPSGTFLQVSARESYTCGIKSDGTVACWGSNFFGESTPPSGAFSQISAGALHACGIKSDGTLACWGDNRYEQATPPSGIFSQVSAGGYDTCGVKNDGTLACWGYSYFGAVPPSGVFQQISMGIFHTCGIKSDDTLLCWGLNNDYGQATPPSGIFSQVSAGSWYTCGVKNNGTLACWGNNLWGQAPVLSLTPSSLATGLVGTTYSQPLALTASVYIPPLPQTFILTAGSLPPGLTLSATGLLSGTPTSGGTFTFTVYGEDDNRFTATQNYTLTIAGPPDSTPPVITPIVSGTLGNNGWYTSTVTLTWTVVDNESPVTVQVGCGPQTVSTDTAGLTFTCQATSTGGTASRSVTIKRDATAPALNPTVSPNPVLLNGTATAATGASDATSGLAAASCNPIVTSSVGAFTVACTATDTAGNVTNASASYVVKYQFLGFLSPAPQDTYKPGGTIQVKFRLADASGTPLADAVAQSLADACRVKVGFDAAAGCASYDARNDLFQLNVKVPKTASVGTHQVVMETRTSDNTLVNTATTAVTVR